HRPVRAVREILGARCRRARSPARDATVRIPTTSERAVEREVDGRAGFGTVVARHAEAQGDARPSRAPRQAIVAARAVDPPREAVAVADANHELSCSIVRADAPPFGRACPPLPDRYDGMHDILLRERPAHVDDEAGLDRIEAARAR